MRFPALFFGEGVEALQRQRKMRTAFVIGHCVYFVHDHGARGAEHGPRLFGGQKNEKRFRSRDQDVWPLLAHLDSFGWGCVASANCCANFGKSDAMGCRERGYFR